MSVSSGVSLTDFTANDVPTKKWMKLFSPKLRLRVRMRNRDFVSSTVKVRSTEANNLSSISWPWTDDQRPSLANDEVFEVKIERQFLLGYKCIRRTKPVTIDQVRTGDHCALPLFDGGKAVETLEDGIEIGDIIFTLQDGATSEDMSSSAGRASPTFYS